MTNEEHVAEMGRVGECVAPWAEKAIRRDERHKLADLLEGDGKTLGDFAKDGWALLGIIVWLLRLDGEDVALTGRKPGKSE